MDKNLFFSTASKFALGVVCTAALLFVPAGTLNFPGGQQLMFLLFVPMFLAGLVLLVNPALLRRRLQTKETQTEQQFVVRLSALVLGSWVSFLIFLFYPMLIVKRIRNEEQVPETELDGYLEYKIRVPYRMIPYIW